MRTRLLIAFIAVLFYVTGFAQVTFNDAVGDIDAGISTGGGTLDIVSMEVSNTVTDITFTLTVNGNISTTDWGKYVIGIATGNTPGSAVSNGWGRPISLLSVGGGMNYWIGSWVDSGGGVELYEYNEVGGTWDMVPSFPGTFTMTPGATSTIEYTVSAESLGLTEANLSMYLDAYSTGGGGTDGAIDALANPNVSVTSWGGSYQSNIGNGLIEYTFNPLVPVELTTFAATVKGNAVELKWNTATEINNYGFDVLASADGTEFGKIAFVAGAGNSNTPKDYSFSVSGNSYKYFRLKQIDLDGKTTLSEIVEATAEITSFELSQNYPNPFNPSTTIRFALPSASNVNLKVFNALGQEVAELVNSELNAGMHSVSFNASNLSSGVYYYRLTAGEFSQINKMMLVK